MKGLITALFVFSAVVCGWAQNPRMGSTGNDNATLNVSIWGFPTDDEYRTGTNSSFVIAITSNVSGQGRWSCSYITNITLTIGGLSVALDLDELPGCAASTTYNRHIRWSTVHFPTYQSEEDEITITLTATVNAEKHGPPPIGGGDPPVIDGPEELETEVSVVVRPYNVALLNATEVDGQGNEDTDPDGAPAVAAIGVEDAREKLGAQNHHVLAGNHHDHLKIAQFLDGSGNPVAGNDPQLLLSTIFFTYTHGFHTNIWDKTTNAMYHDGNVFPVCNTGLRTKPRMNMAFLYSCDLGTYGTYWQEVLGISDYLEGSGTTNRDDAVLFCFGKAVWTKLKPNDTTAELIVPPGQASSILTEKLSAHSEKLLERLALGDKAADALRNANELYPPRHFAGLDDSGDGVFELLNMVAKGDGEATLKKVYRRSTETPEVATEWYLVFLGPPP